MSTWYELPVTDKIAPRPVYARYLMRKHHMPLDPPSEEERADAIRILSDPWEDEVTTEALRILDECG